MSESEVFVTVASIITVLVLWPWRHARLIRVRRPAAERRIRRMLLWMPVVSGAVIYAALESFSDVGVRTDPVYLLMYWFMGMAWVAVGVGMFSVLGVSARWDVGERANPAAVPALLGGSIGMALAFAGANIGDGPGWHVVVGCALLSTCTLVVIWVVIGQWGEAVEHITVDRDVATGWRFGGLLAGSGSLLGRAVAGDYVDPAGTLTDFVIGVIPVVALVAIAWALERKYRPCIDHQPMNVVNGGVLPAMMYLVAATVVIVLRGVW